MASKDHLLLRFIDICHDSFYFSDLSKDSFKISKKRTLEGTCVYILSKEHKFLIIRDDDSGFQVEDLDSVERQKPVYKFHVQTYRDSSYSHGNPVILYVEKNGEKIMICCRSDSEVCAKKMELPTDIPDGGHEALFYRMHIYGDIYRFRATKYENTYLGFDDDKNNVYKLMLVKSDDLVDYRCHIFQPHAKKV